MIGSWIEENEIAKEVIKREIEEEINLKNDEENILIEDLTLITQKKRKKGWTEYIFLGKIWSDIYNLSLKEGQKLSAFSYKELQILKIAHHHKEYINEILQIK